MACDRTTNSVLDVSPSFNHTRLGNVSLIGYPPTDISYHLDNPSDNVIPSYINCEVVDINTFPIQSINSIFSRKTVLFFHFLLSGDILRHYENMFLLDLVNFLFLFIDHLLHPVVLPYVFVV